MNDNTQIKLGPPSYVVTATVYDYSDRPKSFKTLEEARAYAAGELASGFGRRGFYIHLSQYVELVGEEERFVALYHQHRDDKCGGVDCDDRRSCSCRQWALERDW